jgi:large subunit ribosomal protein L11
VAKKVTGVVKLQLAAGKATPAPPVGPALGGYGINIMQFVKEYNEKTSSQAGSVIPVEITVFSDRSFTFEMRTPPASFFLKKAAKITSGSKATGRDVAGSVTMEQVRDIAKLKMKDLNTDDVEAAAKTIAGSARSMGLQVTE